jgi:hypothetical protein
MLPWLFAVLLALNAALFYWGFQREQSREPKLPELPELEYEIRLLSEIDDAGDAMAEAETAVAAAVEQQRGMNADGKAGSPEPLPAKSGAPTEESADREYRVTSESRVIDAEHAREDIGEPTEEP